MRVIGVGFGRTGTTSLKKALEDLGIGPCYHMQEVIKHPSHVNFWREADQKSDTDWRQHFAGYQSGIDWPICDFYQRLLVIYPDAKFILSVRDPERWYESTLATIYRVSNLIPAWERKLLWPIARFYEMANELIWNGTFKGRFQEKDFALQLYEDHLNNVKRIIPAENLLVFDVKEGWEPLCRFLGVSEPARPFPHLNDRQMMKIFLWMIRATTVIVPLVLILLVAFLAWQIVF